MGAASESTVKPITRGDAAPGSSSPFANGGSSNELDMKFSSISISPSAENVSVLGVDKPDGSGSA